MAEWARDNGLAEFQIWSVSDIETTDAAEERPYSRLFRYRGPPEEVRAVSRLSYPSLVFVKHPR